MVSPKKGSASSSTISSISSMRRTSSAVDLIMKRSSSRRKLSYMALWTVVSWAVFSTVYFTSVIDRRSLSAASTAAYSGVDGSSSSQLRPLPPGLSFKIPPGQQLSSIQRKLHDEDTRAIQVEEVEKSDNDTSEDEQIVRSLAPLSDTDPSEDVKRPIGDTSAIEDNEEDVPYDYVESNDVGDDNVKDNLSVGPQQEVLMNAIEDVSEELVAMEISIVSSHGEDAPPACDLLPLNGGRYFWRNRQRLVDLDKKEICGPKLLIIGAKRCGTTNLADMLLRHPRMRFNSCNLKNTMGGCRLGWFQGALKQGKVFDGDDFTHVRRTMTNGWLDEFGKRLPSTDGVTTMTFDKSPSYMDISFFPEVVEYAKAHLPNAKIVATLCNPAERLYSEFHTLLADPYQGYKQLYSDNDVEPPTDFASFVNMFHDEQVCSEKDGFCDTNRKQYLKQGDFLYNLRPWYDTYGQDNVLVVNMDDEPSNVVKSLLNHMGQDLLPESEYPWDEVAQPYASNVNTAYEGRASSYEYFDEEMKWLEQYYSQQNEELAVFLDEDWPRKWNCRVNGDCDRFTW